MKAIDLTQGDTGPLSSLKTIIKAGDNPVDLSAFTVKFRMVENDAANTVVIDDVTTGITPHPTQTFTAAAASDYLTKIAHGVQPGEQVVLSNSGGALPAGLSASTPYFAVNVHPNGFQVSDRPDGAPIDITGAGTGTHSFYVVGSVVRDWQTGDVDEAGDFWAYFVLYTSAERDTVPPGAPDFMIHIASRL